MVRQFSPLPYALLGLCLLACIAATAQTSTAAAITPRDARAIEQLRCGWFDNPSPQNATLTDRQAQWLISEQGGLSSQGTWPPKFAKGQQVRYGAGSYGYGCACMKVVVDQEQERIVRIVSTQAKALSSCRSDRSLKNKEPVIPK